MGERGPLPVPHARRRNRRVGSAHTRGQYVTVARPAMPRSLKGEARAEWNRIVPDLEEIGMLGAVVGPAPVLWALVGASLLGLAAAVLVGRLLPREAPASRLVRRLPARLRTMIEDAWPKVLDGLETMRDLRLFSITLALNVASWFVQALAFFMFGLAFGLDLPFVAYLGVTIAANVVTDGPVTFQNFGTYEIVMLEFLALQGVGREDAFAYALTTHVLTNLWVVLLGLAAMWLMRLRPGEILALRTPDPTL